ncbi:MAG: amidohydrolase family protein [Candidatus Nanohalobium sp.]
MILKDIRYLVTQNAQRQILEDIDLRITEDKIAAIGEELPVQDEKVINCSDKAVMPGLINAHTHVSMTLLRGISDDKKLQDWLEEDIFPAEEKIGEEEAYIGALLGCLEMLKTGTTTFNDMYDNMEQVAEAVEQSGIRAVLSRGVLDIDGNGEKRMEEAVKLAEQYTDSELIVPGFAPHAVHTADTDSLLQLKEHAEEHEAVYHIHLAETREEVENFAEEKGKTPLQHLDELNLVDNNLIAAHGVWLIEENREILEEKGGTIVHNPSANLKLGSGIADIPDLIQRNINVALGTDGVASNNNLNLFEEAKTAGLLHKMQDPSKITAQDILDMATINGAKALNLEDKIGSITVGKKADLITINLNQPDMTPIHSHQSLISNLIYSHKGNIQDVITNGQHTIKNRKHTKLDEQKIIQQAEKTAQKIQ